MKKLILFILTILLFYPLNAQDCRRLSPHSIIVGCDTYSNKLLYTTTKNIKPPHKKLITTKTLPLPKDTVEKLLETEDTKYNNIRTSDSLRYKGNYIEAEENKIKEDIEKNNKDKLIVLINNWDKDITNQYRDKIKYIKKKKKKIKKKKKKKKKVKKKKKKKKVKKKVKKKKKKVKKKVKKKKKKGYKFLKRNYRHKLRVTATAYTSHRRQTDSTPFLAAWNNRIRPGMKMIAVSRDLLKRYGLRNGTKVKISGLRGVYRVRDKMNKRYRRRIDIYMGTNRRRALRWGRKRVTLYW
ncbi:Membrane-bound lytic murein transglycosylase D precursor [hydrothermal vent metagenome]|uniref:Membrane-bound lytic murein transglycosylase D n=1 Tax=hydrothermal vent metagenome TaxID=652676 RepID=A0A1W1EKI9_9ZZZZ